MIRTITVRDQPGVPTVSNDSDDGYFGDPIDTLQSENKPNIIIQNSDGGSQTMANPPTAGRMSKRKTILDEGDFVETVDIGNEAEDETNTISLLDDNESVVIKQNVGEGVQSVLVPVIGKQNWAMMFSGSMRPSTTYSTPSSPPELPSLSSNKSNQRPSGVLDLNLNLGDDKAMAVIRTMSDAVRITRMAKMYREIGTSPFSFSLPFPFQFLQFQFRFDSRFRYI